MRIDAVSNLTVLC